MQKPLLLTILFCVSIMTVACKQYQQQLVVEQDFIEQSVSPIEGYTLAWQDEFNAETLDTTQWKYRVGKSHFSFQRPENVLLEDGKLRIDLKKENFQSENFTGGGVITKVPRKYGYYEVSVKVDGSYGWHEAFWTSWLSGFDDMNPIDSETGQLEIDCFEHYGEYDKHTFTYGAIEWQPFHGNLNRDYKTVSQDLSTSYNTFGFEYTADYLNYYYNGSLLRTIDMREAPNHELYLWLSAIATKQNATDSGAVYFDYIRCYEISPANYNVRRIEFINKLDSLRGPQQSSGIDLWIEAEDFKYLNNWSKEKDIGNTLIVKGFTQKDLGRDSSELTARTGIIINTTGTYKLWVRSRDFDTSPGTRKFKMKINGQEALNEFGNHGTNGYAWQYGGEFNLFEGVNLLDLFDSSQFYARCDKILLTTDINFVPELIGGFANVEHDDSFLGYQPFQSGSIAIVRIGDGETPFILGVANKVFLDEYTQTGALVRTIPMPTQLSGNNKILTLPVSSSDQTEGYLSLSPNGKYLALGGYNAAPGFPSVSSSSGSEVNRVIAIIDNNGVTNTSTSLSTFSGVTIRSAVTDDGINIWTTGGGNGVRYTQIGSNTSTTVSATTGRCLMIFDGQLYTSSTATNLRITKVGEGLPQTSGQMMTNLPGLYTTSGSPYGIYALDMNTSVSGVDVIYIADEWSDGLSKYSLVEGVWVFNGKIDGSGQQFRGLTGRKTVNGVELFATRKNSGSTVGGGEIVKVVDSSGYNGNFSGSPQLIVSAPTNTVFRGIAFVPQ